MISGYGFEDFENSRAVEPFEFDPDSNCYKFDLHIIYTIYKLDYTVFCAIYIYLY